MTIIRKKHLAVVGLGILLAGCSILQPRPDPSRFFVLTPTAQPAARHSEHPLRLGLGPISFPAYLQRPQMVTRIGANEITLSEIHRWGAPIEDNFARVLAQDLSEILGTEQITIYPWFSTLALDYAISVDLSEFDVDNEGGARLLARWRIFDGAKAKSLRTGLANLHERATDDSPDAAVAALSRLVEKLGHELAAGIEALRR
jgi:uncharacterized lipoprotein YmbA